MAGWSGAPRSHIVISVLAILWGLMGAGSFVDGALMSPERLAALPAAQRELWTAMPHWLWMVYALAVFAGLAGAVALFLVSLVAIVAQFSYILFVMDAIGRMGLVQAAGFPALIFLIGLAELLYAARAAMREVLR